MPEPCQGRAGAGEVVSPRAGTTPGLIMWSSKPMTCAKAVRHR
ncbi:Uncharacterised protein [Amycolatopsis camponoti]|uniref:Uncharacterized protein n=1 Tax=Amycolatopsis camponoti TaxID=2606593 RepID=A0A6I8LSK5_9PSEU|nr:Uncharacterised protein [Amycolatopsis camponoti]